MHVKILFHGLLIQDGEEDVCLWSLLAVYPCAGFSLPICMELEV